MKANNKKQTNLENKKEMGYLDCLVLCPEPNYKLNKYKTRKGPIQLCDMEAEILDENFYKETLYKLRKSQKSSVLRNISAQKFYEEIKDNFNLPSLEDNNLNNKLREEILFEKLDFLEIKDSKTVLESLKNDETKRIKQEFLRTREISREIFDNENWEDKIISTKESLKKLEPYPKLYFNDPNLFFEVIEDNRYEQKYYKQNTPFDECLQWELNMSHNIEENKKVELDTDLENIGAQHSLVALKLEDKFYQLSFTEDDLRKMYRKEFDVPKGKLIYEFCDLVENSNKNLIKKEEDLNLHTTGEFKLFEYVEKTPIIMSNVGMVSINQKIYRKLNETEQNIKANLVLSKDDSSPFLWDIKPGKYEKCLSNNLFKAPYFKHKSKDFLLVLNEDSCYLREIGDINLIPQVFPNIEIFSPHSRRFGSFSKNRLKVGLFRLLQSEKFNKNITTSLIDKLFPHFSEGLKRKWTKEYATSERKGKDTIYTLKPRIGSISEEDMRRLVTPESVCIHESMLYSEHRLKELSDEEEPEKIFEPSWILSRNYIQALESRNNIDLYGDTDPTGLGAYFSFSRHNIKKDSDNKKSFLDSTAKFKKECEVLHKKYVQLFSSDVQLRKPIINNQEQDEEIETEILTIRRTFKDKNGNLTEETETVKNPQVIKMYIEAKKNSNNIKTEKPKPVPTVKPPKKADHIKKSLTCSSCGLPGHMRTNKSCPNQGQKVRPAVLPLEGVKKLLGDYIVKSASELMSLKYSEAFHRPVSIKNYPNYLNLIKTPMDLSLVKNKARNGKYGCFNEYFEDVELIGKNCGIFNGENHTLTHIAAKMSDMAKEFYKLLGEDVKFIEKEIKRLEELK